VRTDLIGAPEVGLREFPQKKKKKKKRDQRRRRSTFAEKMAFGEIRWGKK